MIFTVSYGAYLPALLAVFARFPKHRLEQPGSRQTQQTRVRPPSHINRTMTILRGNKA